MSEKEFFLPRRRTLQCPREIEIDFQYPLESDQPKRKKQRAEKTAQQKERPTPKDSPQKSQRKEKKAQSDEPQLRTVEDPHENLMWLFVLGKKELWELPEEVQAKINDL